MGQSELVHTVSVPVGAGPGMVSKEIQTSL